MNRNTIQAALAALLVAIVPMIAAYAEDGAAAAPARPAPKALNPNVEKGLTWLAQHQLPSGAWGQGEESASMGGGTVLKDQPSLGDTCTALMALMRAGNTPEKGPYAANVLAGVKYVCAQVTESDADSLLITKTVGTRIQQKLGRFIDTFMTCTMLADVQEKTTDQQLLASVTAALEKVVRKMEKNQRPDGTWGDAGWAQALEQQMAVKGLNRAAQAGVKVDETVRGKAQDEAKARFDEKSGEFAAKGSAGVGLYAASSSLGAQKDSADTDVLREKELRDRLPQAKTEEERKEIQTGLKRIEGNRAQLQATTQAVVKKLEDDKFVAGFGSNGGEEFLSYLTIGESLVSHGGGDWAKWDQRITQNMDQIQNEDGSWTGHHCITGRTFCTSAALLVLMVDRTAVPIAGKIQRR